MIEDEVIVISELAAETEEAVEIAEQLHKVLSKFRLVPVEIEPEVLTD
jgi:hypothetical protein